MITDSSRNKIANLLRSWSPKTELGKFVLQKVTNKEPISLQQLLSNKCKIREAQIVELLGESMTYAIASVDRICHTLTSGKHYGFRVLVICGNGKNIVGYGIGKADIKRDAYVKAVRNCSHNLLYVEPTLKCRKSVKIGATTVSAVPLSANAGVVASSKGVQYCKLAGISDVRISTGSKGKSTKGRVKAAHNYYKALHQAVKYANCS